LNKKGQLIGIITLDEIRNVMFRPELYTKFQVSDLMTAPPTILSIHDSMESVMKKFEDTQAWDLPVVENNNYVGFVSKAKIFNEYRNIIVQLSEE
jgi:CIC family chloride channel protein